jgi:hypothetical protein
MGILAVVLLTLNLSSDRFGGALLFVSRGSIHG